MRAAEMTWLDPQPVLDVESAATAAVGQANGLSSETQLGDALTEADFCSVIAELGPARSRLGAADAG